MGLVLGEGVLGVRVLHVIEVFGNDKRATLLHNSIWFMTSSLVDVPNEVIMDSLKQCQVMK